MSKPATPSFWSSAIRVCDLSLGPMVWSRRSMFLALLAGAPVLLAAVVRVVLLFRPGALPRVNGMGVSGSGLFGVMIWMLYIRFIIPVLGVFYGTSLIADEVDDKTITYLFTRPIPRSAVLVGKYLAYLTCTVLLILPSVMLVYFLVVSIEGGIAQMFPMLLADLGIAALGLAAYGAVFALVGARLKRPLVIGLVFVFGWEQAVLMFPGYLKWFTVAFYLQGLVPHAMPQDSAVSVLLTLVREVAPATTSVAALVALVSVFLTLAALAVERREYILDQ